MTRCRLRLDFAVATVVCVLLSATVLEAQITDLATFTGSNGLNPSFGALVLSGSTLYGTTSGGGAQSGGEVFSVPVGGGSPAILTSFNGTNGGSPLAGLTLSTDGTTLYGTTSAGGVSHDGEVFSVPVGGGSPTILGSFDSSTGNTPFTNLTLSGSDLYGAAGGGGSHSDGVIFKVAVAGGTPSIITDLNTTTESISYAGFTLSGSTLYATNFSGADNEGAVLKVPLTGGTPTILANFTGTGNAGKDPDCSLLLIGTTLYGTTEGGGPNDVGTVFSLPVGGGTPTILASFNGTNGAFPESGLTLSADGKTLYGTTDDGGANDDGEVFSLPVGGGTPTILASFNGTNGEGPQAGLVLSADGSTLYGTTYEGGPDDEDGVVFSVPTGVPEPGIASLSLLGLATALSRRTRASAYFFSTIQTFLK